MVSKAFSGSGRSSVFRPLADLLSCPFALSNRKTSAMFVRRTPPSSHSTLLTGSWTMAKERARLEERAREAVEQAQGSGRPGGEDRAVRWVVGVGV
jgi:hypothetical protein